MAGIGESREGIRDGVATVKIYISGKMTGEHCFNFERFFYWAHKLRLAGHEPINPAEHDCLKMLDGWHYTPDQWDELIAYDLKLIEEQADAIFMLEGWHNSRGAFIEFNAAVEKGIEIKYEREEV